ncbi:hypothetical protein F5Y16DRAFT_260822 [Xylariaceae sp. FL0255]|nr:hypothetical protein F5Y16DRAFT_260822 [Xylariaceae sp. FL0255]
MADLMHYLNNKFHQFHTVLDLRLLADEAYSHFITEIYNGLGQIPPSFASGYTPAYSNLGYEILAYALEAITKKAFPNMIQQDIISRFNLSHTYYANAPRE